jgi:cation:H+ antiporter
VTAIWPYIELILGFALLIKGADILIDGAVSIARRLRISDLVIGLTVVAFGTSTPELFVNITAAVRGNSDLAIGNILGSNIANTLLVLGVASIIRPLAVARGTVWREIPFSLLAAIVFGLLANDRLIDQQSAPNISRSDGLVLLSFFAVFLYYAFTAANGIDSMAEQVPSKTYNLPAALLRLVGGLVGLCLGGRWIVGGAIHCRPLRCE